MEFWSARDLMPVLGYSIERAKESCRTSNQVVANHFLPTPAKSSGGSIFGLIATAISLRISIVLAGLVLIPTLFLYGYSIKKHKLVELTTS